jgi:hypothetical protein
LCIIVRNHLLRGCQANAHCTNFPCDNAAAETLENLGENESAMCFFPPPNPSNICPKHHRGRGRPNFLCRNLGMEQIQVSSDQRHRPHGSGCQKHKLAWHQRSHSPNTISSAPNMAVVSASMCPRVMKSIAWRCENAVGRILQR